jgi:hypothetical protein
MSGKAGQTISWRMTGLTGYWVNTPRAGVKPAEPVRPVSAPILTGPDGFTLHGPRACAPARLWAANLQTRQTRHPSFTHMP